MVRFTAWLFWTVAYAFRSRPVDLGAVLLKGQRCWWPRERFRPHVWHNDVGQLWDIWFTDERPHTEHRMRDVDVHIGMESGDIVGLTVRDKTLSSNGEDTDE